MPGLGFGGGGSGGGSTPPSPSQPVVPDTVGILPKQAWVDNIEGMTAWGALDLSGQSLTFVDADLVEQSALKQFALVGGGPSLQLHSNNLDAANVESILSQVYNVSAANGITGGFISVGGANMGVVTPFSPAVNLVDGSLVLDLSAINPTFIVNTYGPRKQLWEWHNLVTSTAMLGMGTTMEWYFVGDPGHFDGEGALVIFDDAITFGASSQMGTEIHLGIQDEPTQAQMADFLISCNLAGTSELAFTRAGDAINFDGGFSHEWTLVGALTQTQAWRGNSTINTGRVNTASSFDFNIILDPSHSVGTSYLDVDGNLNIGMTDVASASEPTDVLTSLINANFTAASRTGAMQLTMLFGNEADYPITVGNWTDPGSTGLITAPSATTGTAAVAEVWSALITNLQALSWTGSFNDPVGGAFTAF